jgi:hypothetical protein
MEKLTYSQAYDKIIQAYFRGEIKPFDSRFCFCGTLSGSYRWDDSGYTDNELMRMESTLLNQFPFVKYLGCKNVRSKSGLFISEEVERMGDEAFESTLFAGMCAALEVLKQIHIERGEVIDEVPVFTKRDLSKPSLHPLFEQILKPFKP